MTTPKSLDELPLRDAVSVADERRPRQLLRRARHTEQFQAGFVRQAVALASVHRLVRPHEIAPFVLAATRTRKNVVEAAFVRAQQLAGVLTTIAVAPANRLCSALWALLGHLGEVHRHAH